MITRDPIVTLCSLVLLAVAAWVGLVALSVLAELWRARSEGRRASLRRAVLVCCGVALAVPAGQASADGGGGGGLDGLPMPDRATGPAHAPTAQVGRAPSVVVASGDCLWDLAAAELPPSASARQVAARWRAIYRLNRPLIGPDPNLIHPGQRLVLPPRTPSRRPA